MTLAQAKKSANTRARNAEHRLIQCIESEANALEQYRAAQAARRSAQNAVKEARLVADALGDVE